MQEMIENCMVVDAEWDEIEYGVPDRRRLKRQGQAYGDAEGGNGESEC